MADAVLLVADLALDRFPTRCVVTGESTSTASHIWAVASPHADRVVALLGAVGIWMMRAIGRSTLRVPIPVTARAFGIWRRRATVSAAGASFGVGAVVVSAFKGEVAIAVTGVSIIVLSSLLRARAHSGFWVSAELRPTLGHVIMHRVHPAFDAEARALFVRRLQR